MQLHDRSHRPELLLSARQSKRPRLKRRRRGAARPDPQPRVPGLLHAQPGAPQSLDDARGRKPRRSGLAGHPRKRPDRGGAHPPPPPADAGTRTRLPPGAGALRAPRAAVGALAAGRRAEAAAAPPWAPAPASAPAPWPPATSPRYRATDEALRRERALTFDESDGHAMKVDACDACPYCHDTCADPDCPRCAVWRLRPRKMCRGCAVFSPCEVRRHASAESCWLVAGRDVFDVTSFLPRHPAGTRSIVRKAGGADCTEDLGFHSAKAQKLWMQHKIGRLEPRGAEKNAKTAARRGPRRDVACNRVDR